MPYVPMLTYNTGNNDLPKLSRWFNTNKLPLNLSNTNFIVFTHFNNGISSAAKTVDILYKVEKFVPNPILILLYNLLIFSRLLYMYCNDAWGRNSKRCIDSFLLLQKKKKKVRICSGSHFWANRDPLFNKLRLLKISDITLIQTAIFMYKLSKCQVPPYFSTIFQTNKNIHLYNTRNSSISISISISIYFTQ